MPQSAAAERIYYVFSPGIFLCTSLKIAMRLKLFGAEGIGYITY